MAGYLKVSANSIKSDAEKIDELKEKVPMLLKDLETSMGQLANCWEGPAWAAYQVKVSEYMEMLSEIYEYLTKYTGSMKEAEKDYTRAEQDICVAIRNVNTFF